jgi:O-antigen ligase
MKHSWLNNIRKYRSLQVLSRICLKKVHFMPISGIAVVAPSALFLLLCSQTPALRFVGGCSLLATAATVVVLQSRTATLTFALACIVAAWLHRKRRMAVLLLSLGTVAVLVDGLHGFSLLHKFGDVTQRRLPLWWGAWHMFIDAPVLGTGARTFVDHYREYLGSFPTLSWVQFDPRVIPWAHNLYLEVLAEQGILGLGTLLALFVGAGVVFARTKHMTTLMRSIAVPAAAGLAALAFAGLVELTLLRIWVVVATFLVLGVIANAVTPRTPPDYSHAFDRTTRDDCSG